LRATPRSDHRLRRWPLNDNAGLHGPSSPERRTSPPAACCRRTTRAKVPLLVRATRAPLFRRRFFERRAGWSHRPHDSTKALVPTSPREGQRFPESRGASTASNPMTRGSLLDAAGQRPSITPPPDFRRDGIATGGLSAFVFHTWVPDSDEASTRAWLSGPWPGVVPGIARAYRSAPERFLQPVLPASNTGCRSHSGALRSHPCWFR